jgi:hypothetical protein
MYGENMIRIKYTKYTTVDDKYIPDDIIDKLKTFIKKRVDEDKMDADEMINCYSLPQDVFNWFMYNNIDNEEVEDEYFEQISYVED